MVEEEVKRITEEEKPKCQEEEDEVSEAREEAIRSEEPDNSRIELIGEREREAIELDETRSYVMSRMTDDWYGPTKNGELFCISRTARKKKVDPRLREDCPVEISKLQKGRTTVKNFKGRLEKEEDDWNEEKPKRWRSKPKNRHTRRNSKES